MLHRFDRPGSLTRALALVAALVGCGGAGDESGATAALATTEGPSDAETVLYPTGDVPSSCAGEAADDRTRCLLTLRYAADPAARTQALDFFRESGGIAGVAPEQDIDGGYRGMIHLVPELPVRTYRKHLGWALDAVRDFDALFRSLGGGSTYRWRDVNFRFFRSVGRSTPSAYTEQTWDVFYNVSGSLHTSAAAVRETIFHELFHVNDHAHGDWSLRVLAPLVATIAAKCGTTTASTKCLTPYTPTDVRVGGGTYYAFQPNQNPLAIEYSAELATRYYQEQRAAKNGERFPRAPFKCGPPENARAWELLRDEFFNGGDLVPPCTPRAP